MRRFVNSSRSVDGEARVSRRGRLVAWAALGGLAWGLVGCDPPSPPLSGEVHLPEGLAYPQGATLELQAGVSTGDFDRSVPPVPDVPGSSRETYRQSIPLEDGQRTVKFSLGSGIGSSKSGKWRVVAWVAQGAGEAARSSAPIGHADVELPSKCGPFGFYGYCVGRSDIRIEIPPPR
ncbi:hypothetical protein [Pyxidicoccus xibeiensis]|uniref:hypothetical protein n=1 Tax=Pyxidicoccus xibeiensis TaxID=2906759 RepID=UPI0020A7548E|nr:hypothetical protein [Pyxidicoccus xibeiensis]MCP3139360.1 hypothetical protein [Pyxidicoccus xibeiensis]